MTIGTRVRFKNPQTAAEAGERFTVLELRGDRVLVEAVTEMSIAPTFIYLVADLVPEHEPDLDAQTEQIEDIERDLGHRGKAEHAHEYEFARYCGAHVCSTCEDHKGLDRCFCGWARSGGDGRAELVDMGETIEPED